MLETVIVGCITFIIIAFESKQLHVVCFAEQLAGVRHGHVPLWSAMSKEAVLPAESTEEHSRHRMQNLW